jgi:hypothetical protein
VSRLDEFLPEYDAREYHERRVDAPAETAVAAALGIPVAPDRLVRTLFRVRGLHGGGSVLGALRGLGLEPLVEEPACLVLGASGRPWTPRGGIAAFDKAGPGQVRLAVEIGADGEKLFTETRIQAMDASARRAFRRYWLAVGPFSALIRRRWLAAAERALR